MNIRNLFFNFASVTFCAMMLVGCDSEDVLSEIATGTNPNEMHTCKLNLNITKDEYDATPSRSSSTTWNEGDKIYLTFTVGSTTTTGSAVYNDSTWTINYYGSLTKNAETKCTAVYFENPGYTTDNFVKMTEKTAIYEDLNGKYIFNDSILSVVASLSPKTGRIRFKGNENDSIYIHGLTYYTTYNVSTCEFTKTTSLLKAKADSTTYSEYIYAELNDTVNPRFNIVTPTSGYTRVLTNSILKKGESGYMDIPTKESHNGWYNSLIFKVNGVEFTMLPVEKKTISDGYETYSLYFLAETETTNQLYTAITGNSTSSTLSQYPHVQDAEYYSYNWNYFIENLNSLTNLKFRYPTSTEWEFAAKGGMNSQGYTYSGSNNIADVAWYSGNTSSTREVKLLQPNELGFYDMSGNVAEFTYYNSSYYYIYGGDYSSTASSCKYNSSFSSYYSYSSKYGLRLALSF